MTGTIAGHSFDMSDRCSCGMRWTTLMQVDLSYAGEEGFDHAGLKLTPMECRQVVDEKARRMKLFDAATHENATGTAHAMSDVNVTMGDNPVDDAGAYCC